MLNKYFKTRLFSSIQIESFNHLLSKNLRKLLLYETIFDIRKNLNFSFSNLKIGDPSLFDQNQSVSTTPNFCRLNDLTYGSELMVDVIVHNNLGKKNFKNYPLFKLPIMIKSKACILFQKNEYTNQFKKECTIDSGGYFIIKGNEKIITIQDHISRNKIFIGVELDKIITSTVYSYDYREYNVSDVILKNRILFFRNNLFVEEIPIIIIFRFLGLGTDREILQLIGEKFYDLMDPSFFYYKKNAFSVNSFPKSYLIERLVGREDKLKYEKNIELYILNGLFPHISKHGFENQLNIRIAEFISLMVKKIFLSIKGISSRLTRDNYENKRFELNGELISSLIENLKTRVDSYIKKHLSFMSKKKKNYQTINSNFLEKYQTISGDLEYAFSTGNWAVKKYSFSPTGISQIVPRLSFISGISSIGKIVSQADKLGRDVNPRSLHASQWGLICPFDTPEGESCGLIKNMGIISHISFSESNLLILQICGDLGLFQKTSGFDLFNIKLEPVKVFLNGLFLGCHADPSFFLFSLRNIRRKGLIGKSISFSWETDLSIVNICSDSGRLLKPFGIVNVGKEANYLRIKNFPYKNSNNFVWYQKEGLVEFLDSCELKNTLIAEKISFIDLETTHYELSLDLGMGIVASTIPYPEHNQSPRNTYQCSMGKQSIGTIGYNQFLRHDTILNLLVYPQKPLVKTKTLNLCGADRLPAGKNICIAIMSFSGYDIEDAIILNKSSIQRGLFKTMSYRKQKLNIFSVDCLSSFKGKNSGDFFWDMEKGSRLKKYPILETSPGNSVGDLMKSLNKIPDSNLDSVQSLFSYGCIDKIQLEKRDEGGYFSKFLFRRLRSIQIGDKFSSRHGQKGVCGVLFQAHDLPFTNSGITPDLIMNPHGFPSRMTVGKILELMASKMSAFSGKFSDGSNYKFEDFVKIKSEIKKKTEMKESGKELIFSGITGEPIENRVSNGIIFYQRLKHLVGDKIHSRSRGPRSILTKQPTEGRSKKGGLRFGEMERDCLVSFGVSELILDRLLVSSDYFSTLIDPNNGNLVHSENSNNKLKINLPYACKLLFQELQSMSIVPKLFFHNHLKK